MEIKKPPIALQENQFYPQAQTKKYIFLHHTAGLNPTSIIKWWNSKPDHIATPYLIDRDGSVYELFDPKYWSYALGVKGGTSIEKATIHIELISLGRLFKKGTKYFSEVGQREIAENDVLILPEPFRGSQFYHKYTEAQIQSTMELLKYLMEKFKIPKQDNFKGFWNYRDPIKDPLESGIWSHTSVRVDKSDIVPQEGLIQGLYNL
jgi:N-acetyl-anhydromuramyl-L-alanine amidase AmpD